MEKSTKLVDRLAHIEEKIQNIKDRVGLNLVQPESKKYMNLTQNELRKMDVEELSEAAICLNRSALYINTEISKNNALRKWAQFNLETVIANDFQKYDPYLPGKIKEKLCIKGNEVAQRLQKLIIDLDIIIESLRDTPQFLNNLAYSYNKLADRKRKI